MGQGTWFQRELPFWEDTWILVRVVYMNTAQRTSSEHVYSADRTVYTGVRRLQSVRYELSEMIDFVSGGT